ncbi:MAG: S8 family serine peptidase [Gemmatimonadaceae bacterium]
MRIRHASRALVATLLVAACVQTDATAPMVGAPLTSSSSATSTYVILGGGNSLPANLAASVTAAGGSLTNAMGGIGVAIATSSDPAFASRAASIKGVQSVDADVVLNFEQPTTYGEVDEGSAGASVAAAGVGDVETFRALQWAPDAISAPAAWNAGYQGAGARVAILDGGIRSTHIDIAPNLDVARSASFVPGEAYNFDLGTFWHGTHVAGIVAAPANNVGTVGIAPQATLIGVKVLHNGSGAFSWVMQGIYYAATPIAQGGAGANIINMSLGAGIDGRGSAIAHLLNALSRATSYARQNGVTVIASAGNSAADLDHTGNLVFVPAQSVGVIAVSATGPMGWALGSTDLDRPASYTNYGQSAITFAGPGGDFALPGNQVCTKPRFPSGSVVQFCWVMDMVMAPCRGSLPTSNGSYCWAAGTSMASPAVAGVAALIVGKYGPMEPAQLEAKLRQSADDLGKPGNDDFYGRGRVNAWRAVQ